MKAEEAIALEEEIKTRSKSLTKNSSLEEIQDLLDSFGRAIESMDDEIMLEVLMTLDFLEGELEEGDPGKSAIFEFLKRVEPELKEMDSRKKTIDRCRWLVEASKPRHVFWSEGKGESTTSLLKLKEIKSRLESNIEHVSEAALKEIRENVSCCSIFIKREDEDGKNLIKEIERSIYLELDARYDLDKWRDYHGLR